MADAQEIIDDALSNLGVLAVGESLASYTSEVIVFNRMLDAFNSQRLMIYSITDDTYTLVADQQSYTIGPSGADFTATRPVKIENANIVNETADPDERWPVAILDKNQWANRYASWEFEYPSALYYEPTYPKGTIHLFDIPTTAHKLELFTWNQLTAITDETTTVALPPSYKEALTYEMVARLAPIYGKQVTPDLARLRKDAMARLRSINSPINILTVDYGIGPERSERAAPSGRVTWR